MRAMMIGLILCGFCFFIAPASATGTHLYKIYVQEYEDGAILVDAGIEILNAIPKDHMLAELTAQQVDEVTRLGYRVEYLAESMNAYMAPDGTDEYMGYSNMVAQLETWADENSDIAVLYDLATTPQNHQVWGMKISDNPLEEEDEIVCYFVGCHHGNEKMTVEVPMYFLGYLFDRYGTDPDVTYWVDNREIWVVPMINPDGYSNNSRYNANGVDLNRNYSFHWGESAYAYGPYPFSEVETQVTRDLNLEQHFTTSHSYHSSGEIILYPFAWTSNHPSPDNEFFEEIVGAMCALNGYDPLLSGNLYPHGGEQNDYLYGEKGVMAVTSELSYASSNPTQAQIDAICQDNLPTDLYLLERSGGAQITGHITDASTGNPLEAQFKVVELWDPDEIYARYSEPNFGRYRHLVIPGTYTLQVSKEGYATQTITNISVTAGTPTVVNVALNFTGFPDISVALTYVSGSPVPAGGGNLVFDVFVENLSGSVLDFDAWLATEYEGGDPTTLVMRPLSNYQPGWTINRPGMFYPVPGSWAAGSYMFWGRVGSEPDEVWNEDGFAFTKTGGEIVEDFQPTPVADAPNPFDRIETGVTQTADDYSLIGNYPNPFNPSTVVSFKLQVASKVHLAVYDIAGRQIAELANGWRDAGVHEVTFDGTGLASGMYFYRLDTGDITRQGKMLLVK